MIDDPLMRKTSATEVVEILGGNNYGYNRYLYYESRGVSKRVLEHIARTQVFQDNPGCAQFIYLIPRLNVKDLREVRDQGGNVEDYLKDLDKRGRK